MFDRYPQLPGVVLIERDQWVGMVSRSGLMEWLVRSPSSDAPQLPLAIVHRSLHPAPLCLPVTTPILSAAQQALRRSLSQHLAPIVVQEADGTYSVLDANELNIAHWQLRGIEVQSRYERAQLQLIRTEKMANLGRLVDGVAHEILDPVGFIWGNLSHINDYTQQLLAVIAAYQGLFPTSPAAVQKVIDGEELIYLQNDLPKAIASVQSGANRLKILAASLQNFCHIDDVYPKPADLHEAIDSIVLLINSRLKGEIVLTRTYGHLPPITCYIGLLSQALMNLLLQLVDEQLGEAVRRAVMSDLAQGETVLEGDRCPSKPEITITTQVISLPLPPSDLLHPPVQRWVQIRMSHNGDRWTDPQRQLFLDASAIERCRTQQPSLALSHHIITAQHGGQLQGRSPYPSDATNGAAFEVLLPLM